MLRDEAQVPAELLAVHGGPIATGRSPPYVHEGRVRAQRHAPARFLEPPAEVDLLGEHEEAGVEAAHLFEGVTANEEGGADEELPAPRWRRERWEPRTRRRRSDSRLPEPPPRRDAAERLLRRPVGRLEARPQRARSRVPFRAGCEPLDSVPERPGVRVEQQDERFGGSGDALV